MYVFNIRAYIHCYLGYRVWYNESKVDTGQQIGYINIMPTRLESTPRAFGPKFQTLSEAVDNFNQRWKDGHVTVPGERGRERERERERF